MLCFRVAELLGLLQAIRNDSLRRMELSQQRQVLRHLALQSAQPSIFIATEIGVDTVPYRTQQIFR
jgi:hypothetical protein